MNGIIADTVGDRNTQMSTQIAETVKLSTYKIKKRLEAERVLAVEGHKNTNAAIKEDLKPLLRDIDIRVCSAVKEEALLKALTIFNTLSDYVDVGSEHTYFDDNRDDDISHSAIAESLVTNVSCRIHSDKRVLQTEEVVVTYSLNFWGSICGHINHLGDESEVIFEPKTIAVSVKLHDWEIGTLNNLKAREAESMQYNLEINDIDKKLKNMSSITEDIEFAMISAKATAEGNRDTVDVSDRIAEAILNGVEPSTLLLEN
jgi:hypothetical protein